MLVIFIMAGGSGERFWPLSTRKCPKQLLKLVDKERSLIKMTVDRILPIVSVSRIFIGTNALQAEAIKRELPNIPHDNIIVEPAFKDTAAAIGYGTITIKRVLNNEDITILVLASDHIIKNEENFRKTILEAAEVSNKNSSILTLGIKPNKPETGYGYIEVEKASLGEPSKVIRFLEKPNLENAKKYLKSEHYLWNSGIFIFNIKTIMKAFKTYMPGHFVILSNIAILKSKNLDKKEENNRLKILFEKFQNLSIDFGIMEKAQNIEVIPVDFGWNDVGSFPALDEILPKNKNGTVNIANTLIEIQSKNNIIIGNKKIIATIGVEDFVIVETENTLLVCKKESAQDIKKILKQIK